MPGGTLFVMPDRREFLGLTGAGLLILALYNAGGLEHATRVAVENTGPGFVFGPGYDPKEEGRLFLTEDKDFGELVFRFKRAVPGVVLLRIDPEKPHLKWTRLEAAIARFGEGLFGRYVVIEEARFRSRPLLK